MTNGTIRVILREIPGRSFELIDICPWFHH